MTELYFPNFEVPFPCFSLPFTCEKTYCYYFEKTSPEFGNCVIRVANQGGHKLERLSEILGITRERVRQIEASALRHLAWTSTVRGLTKQVRNILSSTMGMVYFWPLQPFDLQKYRGKTSPSEVVLIDKAFYLGILHRFIRKGVTLPLVECLTLGKVTSGFVCLLCEEREICASSPVTKEDPADYLTVTSFSEILKVIKEDLNLVTRTFHDEKSSWLYSSERDTPADGLAC